MDMYTLILRIYTHLHVHSVTHADTCKHVYVMCMYTYICIYIYNIYVCICMRK